MQLFWSSRSPFARKAMVVAHERGLALAIRRVAVKVTQTGCPEALSSLNPLGQIPTLLLDDGTALYDSAVICEYLAGQGQGPELLPLSGVERLPVLRRQAEADGLMETMVRRLGESRRSDDRSHELVPAYRRKAARMFDHWDGDASRLAFDLGGLSIVVALAYADFRFPGDAWREGRPALAAWFTEAANRPSMRATGFSDESGA